MRINQGQELVIGGYVPSGKDFDRFLYETSATLFGLFNPD
jgi:hypothetical protein